MSRGEMAHDSESETMLLRTLIEDAGEGFEAVLEVGIAEEDFVREPHRRWWLLLLRHHEAGTLGTASLELEVNDTFDAIKAYGDRDTINRILYPGAPWSPHQPFTGRALAVRVHQLALRRVAQQAAHKVEELAGDPLVPIGALREACEMMLSRLFEAEAIRKGWRPLAELMEQEAQDAIGRSNGTVAAVGCRTSITPVDRLLGGGFRPGELIILAARPAAGKSAVACIFGVEAAKQGQIVALFTLEMSGSQVAQRALARLAGIPLQFIRTGQSLNNQDAEQFHSVNRAAKHLPVYVDDWPTVSIGRVRTQLRQLKRTVGQPGLVIVDYLQLMEGERRRNDNRATEVGQLSRGLKILAREMEVPIVALSQINRKIEDRTGDDRKPRISDLAESGRLEQDADIILFVHREEVYEPRNESLRGKMEIIVGKARNGQTGSATVKWKAEYQDIEEAGTYARPDERPRHGDYDA